MTRTYASIADFRAPFDPVPFAGLGDVESQRLRPESYVSTWPRGRGYFDVSHFRAPYEDGYFQSNHLFGLGAPPTLPTATALPARTVEYLRTGEYRTLPRDLGALTNQVSRWVYAGIGAVALYGAYRSYQGWKRGRSAAQKG